ncbi:glycosyltransferase [Nitrosopumilus sp. S6]
MVTEYAMNKPNGSVMRVKWESEALRRQGFSKISIIDNFNNKTKKPTNCLIHAQQLSGKFFEKKSYISDIHGIAFEETDYKSSSYSLFSYKKWWYRHSANTLEKLEKNIWKNSLHLVCASDLIYERVKNIQNATVVRNSVKIDDYNTSASESLKIAVVGPFLPGTQNYAVLEIILHCVKNLPDVDFIFIGSVDINFKKQLQFPNVHFLGKVENFIGELSKCSVLLSPYPEFSHILASKTKMLEAGACKMPVITSESGALGFSEEFLLIGQSKYDIVNHIISLKNENYRKEIGKKLYHEIKENYNADTEIKKLIKLYNEFIV